MILAKVRSEGGVALATAISGIAATNFAPLGRNCTIFLDFQFNYMNIHVQPIKREGRSYEGCKDFDH